MAVKPKARSAAPFPWKTARKIIQLVLLGVFLVLFVLSRRGGWPAAIINIPMRLDPLGMFANLIASRNWLASSALAGLTLLLTLVLGRAWCGWICPLGTLIALFSFKRGKVRKPAPPEAWRRVKYSLLIAILVAALFANLTLLIFDPLTLVFRTFSASLWPAIDVVVTALEKALFSIPALQTPVASFDVWMRPLILPQTPAIYRDGLLYAAVFLGVLGLNFFSPRFWCRYLCPLGALLGLVSKVSLVRRQVTGDCRACAICSRECPTATIDPERGFASDPGECIVCMDCVADCPRATNNFQLALKPAPWAGYDPSRRQVLGMLGATVAGVAITQAVVSPSHPNPRLIQPPGSRDNDLFVKCIRCGECSRACPTSAIQPATTEAGLAGLWTPILITRLGYCDYSCNACGQVCPVQAIPPLSLEEKRQVVIGIAAIDQNRCIAWAQHKPCIVCQEMCPVPDKAIMLEKPVLGDPDPALSKLLVPRVLVDKCIGCGICEYRCPLDGEAAIRVYTVNALLS